MKMLFCITACFISFYSSAQSTRIDTIPFTLDKLLLVFKGTVNGVPVSFAFDTGAGLTVSNSNTNKTAGIRILDSKKGIRDANQQLEKLANVVFDDLAVGTHHLAKVKGVTADMPYLYCADLVLLGQNYIEKFNWKIDFVNRLIYLSESPFAVSEDMQVWPIEIRNSRPFVNFQLNGVNYPKCLIDFGFNGVLDIHTSNPDAQQLLNEKKEVNQANQYLTAVMGLNGLMPATEKYSFLLSDIEIASVNYQQVMVTMSASAETKLGVQFFDRYAEVLTLNHTQKRYCLRPRKLVLPPLFPLDAKVVLSNGKFMISDLNTGPVSGSGTLQLSEEVLAVNGKLPSDFIDNCAFMLWMFQYKEPQMTIKKSDGSIVIIQRNSVFK